MPARGTDEHRCLVVRLVPERVQLQAAHDLVGLAVAGSDTGYQFSVPAVADDHEVPADHHHRTREGEVVVAPPRARSEVRFERQPTRRPGDEQVALGHLRRDVGSLEASEHLDRVQAPSGVDGDRLDPHVAPREPGESVVHAVPGALRRRARSRKGRAPVARGARHQRVRSGGEGAVDVALVMLLGRGAVSDARPEAGHRDQAREERGPAGGPKASLTAGRSHVTSVYRHPDGRRPASAPSPPADRIRCACARRPCQARGVRAPSPSHASPSRSRRSALARGRRWGRRTRPGTRSRAGRTRCHRCRAGRRS